VTRQPVAIALALATAAAGVIVEGRVEVRTDKDPDFDFRTVRTWAWPESGPGVVKMLRTQDDDSEAARTRFEPIIVEAVAREIARRGLTTTSSMPPDVTLTYYLLVTYGNAAQQAGQFVPAVPEWGLPPFAPATTSYRVIQQGSLVIDATSPKVQRVVWRGVAQAEIDELRTDDERKRRIQEAVRDLVRRFPRT
jgi:hypothetical protein